MSNYYHRGEGVSLFAAQAGGALGGRLLYVNTSAFALLNPDGSKTYYHGTGLAWDATAGHFTAGTITAIGHYDISGQFVDDLTDLCISAASLETLLAAPASKAAVLALADALMAGNDTLRAEAGNDYLYGGAGNDILSGGADDDVLVGGRGADALWGGTGSDWAHYASSTKGVTVDLTLGTGIGGEAQGDTLHGIENLLGSRHADCLTGNKANNSLYGLNGDDVLLGGAGNDELMGGRGADTLNGGTGRDWASYRQSQYGVGIDLALHTAGGGDASGDILISIENIQGSSAADQLSGNNLANIFLGRGGEDTLHGRDGNDILNGGGGKDFITGGAGNDIIEGGVGNDTIDGGTGQDVIRGGAGCDVIYGGPDPDIIAYDCAWEDLTATYDGSDYSIWVEAPDGKDHVFSALTFATTTGTYRFDVPTQEWVFASSMTTDDWLGH